MLVLAQVLEPLEGAVHGAGDGQVHGGHQLEEELEGDLTPPPDEEEVAEVPGMEVADDGGVDVDVVAPAVEEGVLQRQRADQVMLTGGMVGNKYLTLELLWQLQSVVRTGGDDVSSAVMHAGVGEWARCRGRLYQLYPDALLDGACFHPLLEELAQRLDVRRSCHHHTSHHSLVASLPPTVVSSRAGGGRSIPRGEPGLR